MIGQVQALATEKVIEEDQSLIVIKLALLGKGGLGVSGGWRGGRWGRGAGGTRTMQFINHDLRLHSVILCALFIAVLSIAIPEYDCFLLVVLALSPRPCCQNLCGPRTQVSLRSRVSATTITLLPVSQVAWVQGRKMSLNDYRTIIATLQ